MPRWTRFNRNGEIEEVVCDDDATIINTTIMKRASVTARDMRTAFNDSSKIIGTDKAIIVNLEVIMAIITVEEVFFLETHRSEVSALFERLKQQFPQKNGSSDGFDDDPEGVELMDSELPFEFKVLEIALEVLCSFVDSNVTTLETKAWPLLEKLTKKVSIPLVHESRRTLKRDLTSLLARVQKVIDEIQHLLYDEEDMADLYITRKRIQNQKPESTKSNRNSSMEEEEDDAEDLTMLEEEDDDEDLTMLEEKYDAKVLKMLLKAYSKKLEIMKNKILMMKEHICNREELIRLKLNMKISNFVIGTLVAIMFGMNMPIELSVVAFFAVLMIVIVECVNRGSINDD